MYRKVLVPLDGSRESEAVLPQLQGELAGDAEVILLKVIPPRTTHILGGGYVGYVILGSQLEESDRLEAITYLSGVTRNEGGASGGWRCEVMMSSTVAQGIMDVAMREEVDLIAMYTHDRKGLARLFRGSVASEVQRTAPCEIRVFTPSDVAAYRPTATIAGAKVHSAGAPSTIVGILREADIFQGLSDEQLDRVAPMARRIHVPSGQLLGHEGELGDHIFIISEGEAQLSAHTDVGEITARVAGPGQSFPIAILVGSGNLITSAQALTDMEVLQLPQSQLATLCSMNTELGFQVYKNMAGVFAGRYGDTLRHLARSVERELGDTDLEGEG